MGRFFNEPWRCGNVGKFTDFYMFVYLHVLLFLVQYNWQVMVGDNKVARGKWTIVNDWSLIH